MEKTMTIKQASIFLSVSVSSLRRWTDSGRMECTKTKGGHRRFSKKYLINYKKQNSVKGIVLKSR